VAQTEHNQLYRVRHSLAHVLAQAVLDYRPGSTLGFGPPIDDGFYYDFILSEPITEEDFPELERRMKRILKSRQNFYCEELAGDAALERLHEMNEPHKREYAEELLARQGLSSLTFYRNGPFLDMCEGPHVENTREIPRDCFKLRSVAGAYWRGDSDRVMMTRIYAWAFENKADLDDAIEKFALAQQRDHKKLGAELGLFRIDPQVGRGLPLWLPNGTVIRDELEKLARELEFQAGYDRVVTPHLAKADLYYTSGHLPYYADDMYPFMHIADASEDAEGDEAAVKESYVLKPMNCPHHHRIYAAEPRSYRDLPLRLAEYGQVYRMEESGAVSGLLRVRGMCMNDAHIYCTPEQVKAEFKAVMALHERAYEILGLDQYRVRLSLMDPDDAKRADKYVHNPEAWARTEAILKEILDEMQLGYEVGIGEAAFYGPKVDIQFVTVTGREESVSTVQLDFAQPERFGLTYIGSDGQAHMPYCIHRAPFSTHERMIAFLIEHFGGAFPTWLAPVQVEVVTVSDQFDAYAKSIVNRLRASFVRAELAPSTESVSKKIREATVRKVPNVVVVGEREQAAGEVMLRRYGEPKQHKMSLDAFEAALLKTIRSRALAFEF